MATKEVAFLISAGGTLQSRSCLMNTDRIERSIEWKATPARVWRALTTYAEFGQWFGVKLEKPFVVGRAASGRVTHPGYEHIQWTATVQKMEPERLFSFTWHPFAVDPKQDYSGETPTLVEFRLKPTANGGNPSHHCGIRFRSGAGRARDGGFQHARARLDGAQLQNIERHVAPSRRAGSRSDRFT